MWAEGLGHEWMRRENGMGILEYWSPKVEAGLQDGFPDGQRPKEFLMAFANFWFRRVDAGEGKVTMVTAVV